jgi:hypothetical protein
MTRMSRLALVLGLLAVAPAPLAAQDAPPPPPPADSAVVPTELVFDREVFEYPTYERRSPFRTLVGDTASGPRFEQVRLRGIIWSADPARSVALFSGAPTGGGGGQPTVLGTRRLRRGETWGNMRVVEIRQDRVVVDVNEFGLTERRVLELTRRRAEGGL